MSYFMRGLLCAAVLATTSASVAAEHLTVTIPLSRGTMTVPGTAQVAQALRQIPGGADVIPGEVYKTGYALGLKDALASTPGVLAEQRYAEESRLSIRGSGLSRGFHLRGISLLQDGIPFNFADGSGDFQEADLLALQHIEIYRGGQALRYGVAGLGGAINMVTPSARTMDYQSRVRVEAGSFQTLRLHADAGQTWGVADAYVSATKTNSAGYRQQTEQDNVRFNGNIGYMFSPDVETRFYVSWNDIEQEVPGALTKAQALETPTMASVTNIANDYARDIRSLRVANRTAVSLGSDSVIEFGGYVNDKTLYHPIFQAIDQESLDLGVFTRLGTIWQAGRLKSEATFGINLGRGVNNADRYINVQGNRGSLTADARQVATNYDFYGENRLFLSEGWRLVTGLQGNIAVRDYEDHLDSANNAKKTYGGLNPKLGVVWRVNPESEIYAGISRSTETPTYSELVQGAGDGFIPVKAQRAWTAEVGTRGGAKNFAWDATLYRAWLKDEMLQYTVATGIPASTFNADGTIHQGFELGASWKPFAPLTFSMIYNLNDFYFDGDMQFGDNQIAGAPPHQFRFSLRYEGGRFHLEPKVEWVPEAGWVDFANTLKADSYAVLGLKAGWEPVKNTTLFLDARNLTDERYIPTYSTVTDARTAATNVFYPGEGRALYAGFSVKF
ncbi:MAG: TonB-dependent receptor [Micavibrio aeruginosavorus]|uniref:TonB-dependent receptor n=1 Tax=Micavibrio aeruginosavorus TaxID=349221 RepID=A0A7T5UHJ8_9BACT|nr:MAG: TonB-dependent receptor [Micavibrio aeruginosavorus]